MRAAACCFLIEPQSTNRPLSRKAGEGGTQCRVRGLLAARLLTPSPACGRRWQRSCRMRAAACCFLIEPQSINRPLSRKAGEGGTQSRVRGLLHSATPPLSSLRVPGHRCQMPRLFSPLYPPPMCGRFTHTFSWSDLNRLIAMIDWPQVELPPRFNLAPTQDAPIIRLNQSGKPSGSHLRWGLIPSWAKDASSPWINARAETLFEKPSFRDAATKHRCIVPISGFYEWQPLTPGPKPRKQPYFIRRPIDPAFSATQPTPMLLAGIFSRWAPPGAVPLETFSIITVAANAFMKQFHDRMPAILTPHECAAWLDPTADRPKLEALLRPQDPCDWQASPVSTRVNSPSIDAPDLVQQVPLPPSIAESFTKVSPALSKLPKPPKSSPKTSQEPNLFDFS
jgi:putative SOS response-associated peptidase YedK